MHFPILLGVDVYKKVFPMFVIKNIIACICPFLMNTEPLCVHLNQLIIASHIVCIASVDLCSTKICDIDNYITMPNSDKEYANHSNSSVILTIIRLQ